MKQLRKEIGHLRVGKLTVAEVDVVTALLLASGQVVDLNGESYGLVLDADADTAIGAPTDDVINIKVNGAEDFRILANIFRALSGSVIETNTINETTAASGVTIDSVLAKDGGIRLADGAAIAADVVSEKTADAGVTVDGLLVKDGHIGAGQAITGDGAITIAQDMVVLSKGSAAAITIAAPTAGVHDFMEITVVTLTAQAHVITQGTVGFNAKGSSGTVTFTAAIGNSVTLRAYNGNWYTVVKNGVTVA